MWLKNILSYKGKNTKEVNCKLTGTIIGKGEKPTEGATVLLLDLDGNLIKETKSGNNGDFYMDQLNQGTYQVYAMKEYHLLSHKVNVCLQEGMTYVGDIALKQVRPLITSI